MDKEDHIFLHDITNKLAKIEGYTEILKFEIGEENPILAKILKSNNEAICLIKEYRLLLEKRNSH